MSKTETIASQSVAYDKLLQRLGLIADLNSASNLAQWDQETQMPKAGALRRANMLGTLSRVHHEYLTAKETINLIEAAEREDSDSNPDSDRTIVINRAREDYERATKLPPDFVDQYSMLTSQAQNAWATARAEDRFEVFKPYLEQVLTMTRQKAEFLGYKNHPYDALLDEFEPGLSTAHVREILPKLRAELTPLIKTVSAKLDEIDDSCLTQNFPVETQRQFCERNIHAMGVPLDSARLDVSVHPFMMPVSPPSDVRLTTRFNPDFSNASLFSSMHEAGHALYELGVNKNYARTPLGSIRSMSLHESQSRLWENLVGRSREFWNTRYEVLQGFFPQQLQNTPAETFYRAINKVSKSFIRVQADELTYNLHIILRFELELELLEGKVKIGQLPSIWKEQFEAIFGTAPPSDREGVLQDVHWSAGLFGYFPTYALGNLISTTLFAKAQKDMPNMMKDIESGNFVTLLQWLRDNVHKHGSKYSASELVKTVSGKEIGTDDFVQYMRSKFGGIYNF